MSGRWLRPLTVVALAALPFASGQALGLSGIELHQDAARSGVAARSRGLPGGERDLSGVWRSTNERALRDLSAAGQMPPMQPWGATLYNERLQTGGKDRPSARCLPRGLPGVMLARDAPWKVVQAQGVVVILFDQSLHFRQIFTDGRALPEEIELPAWLGYSIGNWEGDTLVVHTVGVTDQTWLDDRGHPHSGEMQLTERFRRASANRLDLDVTIDDSNTYRHPWKLAFRFELRPESDLTEHVCGHPGQ
jgi:hypothetical protein